MCNLINDLNAFKPTHFNFIKNYDLDNYTNQLNVIDFVVLLIFFSYFVIINVEELQS